jgi:hypothetical protein
MNWKTATYEEQVVFWLNLRANAMASLLFEDDEELSEWEREQQRETDEGEVEYAEDELAELGVPNNVEVA